MSRGHRGPQCHVEGCARSGAVDVYFPSSVPVVVHARRDDDGVIAGLRVCRPHGDMLGDVEDLAAEFEEEVPCWSVVIDPAKAEGWRLAVIVRPSGRHAVVLFPPEVASSDA